MDLLQLRYFCHAAATQNFSKTAEAFCVPPSNISQCIRRLEQELSVELFIRTSNRVRLSPKGALFYRGIQNALDTIEESRSMLYADSGSDCVRVGIRLHRQVVMRTIEDFRTQYPNVSIIHKKVDPVFPIEDYDIVIAGDDYDHPNYRKKQIAHQKHYLHAYKGLFPAGEPITIEVLKRQKFISLPPGSYMYRDTVTICRALGFEPQILTQVDDSIFFVPHCIEEKAGVALSTNMTRWVLHMAEFLDMVDIGEFYRDTFIYLRKDSTSPYVLRLYDMMIQHYESNKTMMIKPPIYPPRKLHHLR